MGETFGCTSNNLVETCLVFLGFHTICRLSSKRDLSSYVDKSHATYEALALWFHDDCALCRCLCLRQRNLYVAKLFLEEMVKIVFFSFFAEKTKKHIMVSPAPTHDDCVGAYLSSATLDPLPTPKMVFCCFLNIPTRKDIKRLKPWHIHLASSYPHFFPLHKIHPTFVIRFCVLVSVLDLFEGNFQCKRYLQFERNIQFERYLQFELVENSELKWKWKRGSDGWRNL